MTVTAFQNIWGSWQEVAIVAALLSISFAAIAYMFSRFFRMRSLELWAKDEIYQAVASAFIVGAAIGIVIAISSLTCTVSGGCSPGNDHMDLAITIMERMKNSTVEEISYIFALSMRVGFVSKMGKYYDFTIGPDSVLCTSGICNTAFGFSWYLWAGASMISDSIDYTFSLLFPIVSSFIAQLYLLRFIQTTLFPSLLALGIILRTFFFTRKVGGLLIAVALALYTIYPLMYIMLESYFTFTPHTFYYPDADFWTNSHAWVTCAFGFMPDGGPDYPFCTSYVGLLTFIIPGLPTAVANYGESTFMFKSGCNADNPADPNNLKICANSTCDWYSGQRLCDPANPPNVYAGMRSKYNGVLPTVGYLLMPATFIPLLIILVTISFIKVLSPLLGGDIEIAGLTKII